MLTYNDRAIAVDRIYKTCTDVQKLKKTCIETEALAGEIAKWGKTDSDIGQDVASLYIRLKAKTLLLAYFDGGYYSDDLEIVKTFVALKEPIAREKGWNNTADICSRLADFCATAGAALKDAVAVIDSVRDYHGDAVTDSVDILSDAKKFFTERTALIDAIPPIADIFGDRVRMPDFPNALKKDFNEIIEWCDRHIEQNRVRTSDKFFSEHTKKLDEFFASSVVPEYYPSVLPDGYSSAGVIVLNTPFEDEALTALRGYSKSSGTDVAVLNCFELGAMNEENIADIFDAFAQRKLVCAITNIGGYHSDDDCKTLFGAALALGRTGNKVFIIDNAKNRGVYERLYGFVTANEGYSALDISNVFLHMPPFRAFMQALETAMLVTPGADGADIKESMPFAGYVGLNALLDAAARDESWRNVGAETSELRYDRALEYLSELPSQIQLLDLGWGQFESAPERKRIVKRDFKGFDYDGISCVEPENIRRIVESSELDIYEKCGGVALYCTLAGMDRSVWKSVPPEEKSERVAVAARFVSGLLSNLYTPEVRVIDRAEMEEKSGKRETGGLCCDGGKLILFRSDCVESIDWTVDAICHECFHAFQATAESGGFKPWHRTELGVTAGRVDQWRLNRPLYKNTGTVYEVEIIECDAKAFGQDCTSAAVGALTKVGLL